METKKEIEFIGIHHHKFHIGIYDFIDYLFFIVAATILIKLVWKLV